MASEVLRMADIRSDGGTQSRARLEPAVIAEYAEALRRGECLPAVIVYYDGQAYWLADGFHRVAGAQQAGQRQIQVDIRQGTRRDAILHAVGANATHGLRRTSADKRRAVQLLLADAEWGAWSNAEIARRCHVGRELVVALRKAHLSVSTSEGDLQAQTRNYVTRHGTVATMATAKIGSATWTPVWQLERALTTWLSDKAADPPAQLALLEGLQQRTTAGLIALDELLSDGCLPAPRRKDDVLQAVNNVIEQLRQVTGSAGMHPADGPRAQSASDRDAWPAITAEAPAGVAAWLHASYPGDERAALQAVHPRTPAGLAQPHALTQSGRPPVSDHSEELQADCSISLMQESALAAPASPVFPLTCGAATIVHGDSRRLTEYVAPDTAQLVVTSPPYNVRLPYSTHDDNLPPTEYWALLHGVFEACYQSLAPGGRIAVVVPFGIGRNPWTPLAAPLGALLTALGFTLRGEIVWDKLTTGNRTTWGSWESSSDPVLRDRAEALVVAHKGRPDLPAPHPLPADWLPGELFMALTQNVWGVATANPQQVGHPAPFPIELAERLIRLYAYPGAHIVDPFGGSGTTALAALRLSCRATVVDVDASYCALAAKRCQDELAKR